MTAARLFFVIAAAAVLSAALMRPSPAAAEVRCLDCHSDKTEGASVHPYVTERCTLCHMGVDASSIPHEMVSGDSRGLPAGVPDLCFTCHKRGDFAGRTVHAPVAQGLCTSCHTQHSSQHQSLLVAGNVCFFCHDQGAYQSGKSVHAPVAAGMCPSCHQPHKSENPSLLRTVSPGLCYGCHDKKAFTGRVVHAPVFLGTCATCHDPHVSESQKLTTMEVPGLCFRCHDEEAVRALPAHSPAALPRCSSCHMPHAGEKEFLLY